MLTKKILHVVEFFNLEWEIFCRPKKKMMEWKDPTLNLHIRVNSIAQYKFMSYYIHFILGVSILAFSQTYYGIFSLIGIILFAYAGIHFITTSMLIYGNNFNCPRLLLPFVVLNLYFSYIVYSRYKEMFILTTKSSENMKENNTEKGFHSKNDVISIDKDEKVDIDVVKEECNSFYIPEVHK